MFPIYFSTRPKQLQELQVALDKGAAVLDANSWSQRIEHCRNNQGRGGQNASKDVRFEAQIVFFQQNDRGRNILFTAPKFAAKTVDNRLIFLH